MNIYLYILIPSVLAIVFLVLFRYSKYLSYFFVLSSFLYMSSTEGIGMPEAIFFSVFAVTIAVNVLPHIFRLEFNDLRLLDGLVLLSVIHVLYAVALGLISGNTLFDVLKEPAYYIGLFGYLAYRYASVDEKKLFYILVLLSLFVLVRNFINYQQIIMGASEAWRAEKARASANEPFLMLGFIFSLVSVLYSHNKKIIYSLLILLFLVGIVITQSRAYWVGVLASILIIFFLVDSKKKLRITSYVSALVAVGIIIVTSMGYNIIDLVLQGLYNRISSFGDLTDDPSLIERYLETKTVLAKIAQNPIAGYGFGTTYLREFLLFDFARPYLYVHNGYLAVWYKMGLIGVLSFISLFLLNIRESYLKFKYSKEDNKRIFGLISLTLLLILLMVNVTSPQFYSFDSLLIVGVISYYNVVNDKE